ncbi:hypothetical protein RHS04_09558 [Rhizoctonia solani]|uniref:RecQ-mediated genome instability protein 1 n=1 Tax=Rhizoctonia solani TaxID=456999 RepID=A0A8H7M4G7_9AGAM|nr:hypothetical protein RHS04_09558 [Rhizoctonia solani]KAF8754218.1 hypothetical protein RHS01_06343 [Rhizoctonia solani]
MAPPPRLVNWLKGTYNRPLINPEWLIACYEYITTELGISSNDFEGLKTHVEEQLLQSSLSDSAVHDTGFPDPNSHDIKIKNTLCEIVALTEIGHSAFTLKNVRQARVDKEDLAGLAGDLEDGEDYTIPKYPRSMLRFELSDGTKTMRAIEYRRIPDFELGVTPLGTKVGIYVKEANVRRGIIYLEPRGIQIKGYQTEELEERQDRDFVRGLRLRMRLPEEDPETEQNIRMESRQPERRIEPPPAAPVIAPRISAPHTTTRAVDNLPPATTNSNSAPIVDLDPDDLEIDLGYEDSYSIGDGVRDGHDGDADEVDYEINEAFLQDLDEAEQRVQVVIDVDEDSQVEAQSTVGPTKTTRPVDIEEVIDISD